jgi:hypothetical protein
LGFELGKRVSADVPAEEVELGAKLRLAEEVGEDGTGTGEGAALQVERNPLADVAAFERGQGIGVGAEFLEDPRLRLRRYARSRRSCWAGSLTTLV